MEGFSKKWSTKGVVLHKDGCMEIRNENGFRKKLFKKKEEAGYHQEPHC